jgi:hypothetical protein
MPLREATPNGVAFLLMRSILLRRPCDYLGDRGKGVSPQSGACHEWAFAVVSDLPIARLTQAPTGNGRARSPQSQANFRPAVSLIRLCCGGSSHR